MAEPYDTDPEESGEGQTEEGGDDNEFSAAPLGVAGLSALDVPGAAQAMGQLVKSSQQARAALRQAREQIKSRQYNKALPWLAISQALSQPTRTGAFGEVMGNLAGALQGPIREREAFNQQRDKELLGVNTQIAGLDEKTAMAQLKLAELRARLGVDAGKVHNELVELPNGDLAWRSPADARQPGVKAGVKPPTPPSPEYHQFVTTLPDGKQQSMILDVRTGKAKPDGDPYTPVSKMSGTAMTAARSKLGTVAILRSQLQEVRDKFAKIKDSQLSSGLGRGWVPTAEGRAFDAAVNVMRGTLRGLTRIPGEGSMSDWEGRLDQAKLPSRGEYNEVTEDQMRMLENLLNGYELTTRGMLGEDTTGYIAALQKGENPFPIIAPPVVAPKKPAAKASESPAKPPAEKSSPPPTVNPDDYLPPRYEDPAKEARYQEWKKAHGGE